ncbi:polysaccharide biosynthesis tyrosine autokinase [Anabaenopsis tanganyikae CS-531]|uniref:Polysaccharide biosynthesis tyrosine autokinase n=2 Tax=Anabaenopsis TaxID=110103 RepID=A0ABT5AXK2_9CYAN|nr:MULTISPECIES: polysaccharide biosynthesis tyrosine autokinase [Anabaenopsis]MDB9541131.1 polysaccharide biosynthesis tyrosine autokinase [Anabaenopsis arnoldii]MDH6093570.1 polysaccharide biosynthesis tyrosine autokinase [Anabaenopsis arnoldii]MDH6106133.1 polysaccharide biosynthesis tyrosine autokinase [Anabaenopsis tanganyikae CS-531]
MSIIHNQTDKPVNPEQTRNSITPFFPYSPILENQQQGEDWNYKELLSLLRRRVVVVVGVATAVLTGVGLNIYLNPKTPEYESSFQMLVEPVDNGSEVLNLGGNINPTSNPISSSRFDYETQILVLLSPQVLQNSIKQLQANYPNINYGYLSRGLRISRVGQTKIIQVNYRSQDPVEVKDVLEKIAADYLGYSQGQRRITLSQGLKYLDEELPNIQKRVNRVQEELEVFRRKYNFLGPDVLAGEIGEQTTDLTQQLEQLELQLAQARADWNFLQTEDGVRSVLDNYPVYRTLNQELRQLEIQIATQSAVFQDENPTLITLKEKQDKLKPLIERESQLYIQTRRAEADKLLKSLELNQQELEKNRRILELERQELPTLIREYTEIQRRLDIANESLNRFLSAREDLLIQTSQTEQGWQLIHLPNLPTSPIASSTIIRDIILGIAASISLGIGAALLLEKLDHTYHNALSLKERIKVPVLGNIPLNQEMQLGKSSTLKLKDALMQFSDGLMETNTQRSTVAKRRYSNYANHFIEAIRLLYTNIQLLSSDGPISSITISSSMQGDGKSTVAFYLAQIAVSMGKKVLLVDADLRRPSIHTLANLSNLWGLSSLITTDMSIENVVTPLPAMNELSIITSGPIPPDAPKLLSSGKMKKLMTQFQYTFDLVIYDAPPIVGLADTNYIAPQTDGVVMIARMDKTDRSVFERALTDLKNSPINVLGVVANGQQRHSDNYYNYYYYQPDDK